MSELQNVTVTTTANIYFDGKCVSHGVTAADGTRVTLGVIFPSTLHFTTGAPELMEIQAGRCRVRLTGSDEWSEYAAGESFSIPGDSSFDIDVLELVDYICHYG